MSDGFEKNKFGTEKGNLDKKDDSKLVQGDLLKGTEDLLGDLTSSEILQDDSVTNLTELSDSLNTEVMHDGFADQTYQVLEMNYSINVDNPRFTENVDELKVKPTYHLFLSNVVLQNPEKYQARSDEYRNVLSLVNDAEFIKLYNQYENSLKKVVREKGDTKEIIGEYSRLQSYLVEKGLEDLSLFDVYSDVQSARSLIVKTDRLLNEKNVLLTSELNKVRDKAEKMRKSGELQSDQEYVNYLNSQTNIIVQEYGSDELKEEWKSISSDEELMSEFLEQNEATFRAAGASFFEIKREDEVGEQVTDEESLSDEAEKNSLEVFGESEIKEGRIDVKVDANYSFSVKIFDSEDERFYFVEDKNGSRGPFKAKELNDRIDDGIAYDYLTEPFKSSSKYADIVGDIPYSAFAKLAKAVVGNGEDRNFKIVGDDKQNMEIFSKILMVKGGSLENNVRIANERLTTEDSMNQLRELLNSGKGFEKIKTDVDKFLWIRG